MTGRRGKVVRIVSAVALLAVVAGCGSTAHRQRSSVPRVPRALAQTWEGQVLAIRDAAHAGQGCEALHLATALRAQVAAERTKVPLGLRAPLATGVTALVNSITCTPPPPTPAPRKKPEPKPPHEGHGKHDHHDPHGHGDGGGNDQ